jgi:hypothetical protein
MGETIVGILIIGAVCCAICGGIVGARNDAYHGGMILGLLFGPVGVLAAFALDSRPSCPHCGGRIDAALFPVCPHCGGAIDREKVKRMPRRALAQFKAPPPTAIPAQPLGLCPRCRAAIMVRVPACPSCGAGIKW